MPPRDTRGYAEARTVCNEPLGYGVSAAERRSRAAEEASEQRACACHGDGSTWYLSQGSRLTRRRAGRAGEPWLVVTGYPPPRHQPETAELLTSLAATLPEAGGLPGVQLRSGTHGVSGNYLT